MMINEIDPFSSWDEIIPKLDKLLKTYENHEISKIEFLDKLHSIHNDVKVRKILSTVSIKEAFQWDGLLLTIENIISNFEND